MDYDKWKQPEVPEHLLFSSSRSPKLKLQSIKKVQGHSTPMSKLCLSLTNSTLVTPVKVTQETVESMFLDTPQKSIQNVTTKTPSKTLVNSSVKTPVFTPESKSLNDIGETVSFSPLDTPKTSKIDSPIGTPLCVALGKSLNTKTVSSTPRRSSRKSIGVIKSHVSEFEGISSKAESKSNSLEDNSRELGYSDKNDHIQVIIHPPNEASEERKNIDNSPLSLCASSSESAIVPNALDWLPEKLHGSIGRRNGITSEPRQTRKSDVGVSARRLSFSNKKSRKQKNVIPEYDPDDDIFAQGLVPAQFNVRSLKNEIGKILNNRADIPSPQLRKSYSCGNLNNVVNETQPVSPVSSRKKQSKRSPSSTSKATIKRALSAPELQKCVGRVSPPPTTATASVEMSSCPKVSSEGKIRALLRARDIIKNIRERAKNFSSNSTEAEKLSSGTNSVQTKEKEISSRLDFQNQESSVRTSDSLKEATDTYDELLPPTQPFESFILGDVTAYVEVISKNEDISAGVRKELVKLGATVVPAFNRDVPVTHVVFNEGNISTYKKAIKRNIPLVSVLWIEACRKAGVKVHESLFPPHQIERYESPAIQKELKKRRIMRFYSDETQRPSPRRRKGVVCNETTCQPLTEPSEENSAVRKSACAPKWVEEVAGGNGMVRMLVKMTGISKKEFKELVNRPPTPESDVDVEQNSPLPVRLLRKLAKNLHVSDKLDSDETSNNIEVGEASSSKTASYETSFAKKLNEFGAIEEHMEICVKPNEVSKTSVSAVNETTQMEHSNMQNVTQRKKVHSFARKLNKIGAIEEHMAISDKPNEVSKTSVSAVNETTQMEYSNMQNVTQNKKVSKRKLLSPVQETVSLTSDGDDNASTVVVNPHSCTPRKLNGEKKRKSDNADLEELGGPENNKCEPDKANMTTENDCIVNSVDPVRRSRRSSSYFVKTKRNSPSPVLQKPAVVCTQLLSTDVDLVVSVVEKLGMFVVEKNVTSHTTHIVAGAPKRTMKILKGMARGCWIVTHEWVLRSLEAGKWLDEEEFELTMFSPAVQKYRLEKLCFGGIFKPDIFSSCGPIFVSSHAAAPRGDLVELILLCGGVTVSRISKAKIAVGKKYPDVICVTALWVLDSIQYYCCKSFDNYQCI